MITLSSPRETSAGVGGGSSWAGPLLVAHNGDDITIVSGLPRCGTSLMMQMIDAGGLRALTDEARARDKDNPRGYYELEAVKRTKQDPSWLDTARGRVVKMVYLLLYDLPADRSYRVIFMKRDLREVVRSQADMLARRQTRGADLTDSQMIKAFQGQLAKIQRWLDEQSNFRVLFVNYNDLMKDPAPPVEAVDRFLGGQLHHDAMLRCMDPSLYRQRAGS